MSQVGQQVLELQQDQLSILESLQRRLLPDHREGRSDALSDLSNTVGMLAARVEEMMADRPELSSLGTGGGSPRGSGDQSRSETTASGVIPPWLKPNYTEPRVLTAIKDLCEAGATVFDVGANFGGITVAMSRSVGPKGVVCSFEANPTIVARCQTEVIESGCGNVQVYHGAIYGRSGEEVELYISENQVSDSIYHKGSNKSIAVRTIALDDFVRRTDLVPSFVKMDIEGAEYDALVGFKNTLVEYKPVLILEQSPGDPRCLDFLKELGYGALDLSTYESLESIEDLPSETVVTDILYAPKSWFETSCYRPGTTEAERFSGMDFIGRSPAFLTSRMFKLPMGRYIVKAEYGSSAEEKQELFCGIWSERNNAPLMQHHGHSDNLSTLAHRWIFDAPNDDISIFFLFPQRRPESFEIRSVTVLSVDSLRGRSPQLFT